MNIWNHQLWAQCIYAAQTTGAHASVGFNKIVCAAVFELPNGEWVRTEQLCSPIGLVTSGISIVIQHIEIAYR